MRFEGLTYDRGEWLMNVSLHCNNHIVFREGGTNKWTTNDNDFDVDMWEDWLEELFQANVALVKHK